MPIVTGKDTAKTRRQLTVGGKSVSYYSIPAAQDAGLGDFSKLPASLKVVLENMLRFEDGGFTVSVAAELEGYDAPYHGSSSSQHAR